MSKLRSLNTIIWSDTWFEILSPEEKLLFIYFVTNEKTNMLGVYEISVRKVSFETGIDVVKIEKYLKKFEANGKIRYASNRVLLLNFLKHQNYNFNMMKSAIRTYNSLPQELKNSKTDTYEETEEGFETLCKGFAGVRKYEYEYEVETELETEGEFEGEKPKEKNDLFEIFWEIYPNKIAKAKCKKEFAKLSEVEKQKISETINDFVKYKPFATYIYPNPLTYLNGKRWEDVIPKFSTTTNQFGAKKDFGRTNQVSYT